MRDVLDAIEAFFTHLSSVELIPLLIAVGCHLVKLACTSRAWRNVIAAAYPEERVPWPPILGAYVAGVGINAVIPARGGDVVRLYLAHRAVRGSTYTTLASTYVVMAIADTTFALVLFGYALALGVLPGISLLPNLRSFDFAWFIDHPRGSAGIVFLLVVAGLALAIWLRPRIDDFRARFARAFSVLRPPSRYARSVLTWQLADWTLRLVTIWFFLGAFGIDQSVQNVLLVQVTFSLATLVPISPGGIGTEQAFLVYVFRGKAPGSALLAFSVGMRVTLTTVNAIAGAVALLLSLRTVRVKQVIEEASAAGAAQPTSNE
jgi:glycosyltransferase 2 family protein